MENIASSGALTLMQYGAMGVFCVFLIAVVMFLGIKLVNSIQKLLIQILEVVREIQSIAEQTSKHYKEVIEHERDRSEECYEKVVHTLGELKAGQGSAVAKVENIGREIISKLENIEKHSIRCSECQLGVKR